MTEIDLGKEGFTLASDFPIIKDKNRELLRRIAERLKIAGKEYQKRSEHDDATYAIHASIYAELASFIIQELESEQNA
jgi:hypothetical protein